MAGKRKNAVVCSKKCVDASYRKANREIIAEKKREYYQANREALAEHQREYQQANRETMAEYQRKYYQANAETIAEYQRERRNSQSAAASTLHLAHTITQIQTGDLTNGNHEPE